MNKIKMLTTLAVTSATLLATLPASAVQVFTCNHKPSDQFISVEYLLSRNANSNNIKASFYCNYKDSASKAFVFKMPRQAWQLVGKNWKEKGINFGECRSTNPNQCALILGLTSYSKIYVCNRKPLDQFISSEYTVGGKNNDEVEFKCYHNNHFDFKTKLNVPLQNWEIVGKNWKKVGDNRGTCQSSDPNECALIAK